MWEERDRPFLPPPLLVLDRPLLLRERERVRVRPPLLLLLRDRDREGEEGIFVSYRSRAMVKDMWSYSAIRLGDAPCCCLGVGVVVAVLTWHLHPTLVTVG